MALVLQDARVVEVRHLKGSSVNPRTNVEEPYEYDRVRVDTGSDYVNVRLAEGMPVPTAGELVTYEVGVSAYRDSSNRAQVAYRALALVQPQTAGLRAAS